MTYEVSMASPAERDLIKISDYIAIELGEPAVARKLVARIKKAVLSLDEMPYRHAEIDSELIGVAGIRHLIEANYIVFYHIREDKKSVRVLRVLYGKRNWQTILWGISPNQ